MIKALFQTVDNKDAPAFAGFLTEDCVFKFGNMPDVCGREAIQSFVAGFFESIKSLSHSVEGSWQVDDQQICRGEVTYTRQDQSHLTVPFAVILKMQGDLISHYQIYADTSTLYTA